MELRDVVNAGPPPERAMMRRVAAEAVIVQDMAEEVLEQVRRHERLGVVAPRGGPLVRRFFDLRDQLPAFCPDAEDEKLRQQLDSILHAHALSVSVALELLATEWRSEKAYARVGEVNGLGQPAVRLDEIYHQLSAS